ncbi:MAG: formylglycine-generating enzyme family protein [Candidatus Brocadiae bacterium]|nr:formylglycine-generating enzyme family protein [Candidatus Brocadiia bacterium]
MGTSSHSERCVHLLLGLLTVSLPVLAGAPRPLPPRFTETIRSGGRREPAKTFRFDMVLIPGGTFTMGSPPNEPGRQPDEGPQHTVRVSSFYICTTEATLDLFFVYLDEVMGPRTREFLKRRDRWRERLRPEQLPDPARPWKVEGIDNLNLAAVYGVDGVTGPSDGPYGDPTMGWGAGRRPIMAVTWFAAVDFCRWLRFKTGRRYRLPSEAEWEYACRAGTVTAYSFGDDTDMLEDHAWFEDNSDEQTHPVAQRKANPWGLYDMHGNVMEWCHDFYDPKAYGRRAKHVVTRNPFGPKLPVGKGIDEPCKRYHVARGGSWVDPPEALRSAARLAEQPSWRYKDPQYPKNYFWLPDQGHIGFRVACEADSVKK